MKIGVVLHPYNEKNPAGLGRFILELTREMIEGAPMHEFVLYVKGKPKPPDFVDGKRVRHVTLGSSLFWLEGLRSAFQADVYIFNTPVMPLFWRPRKSVVVVLDFAYLLFPAKSLKESFSRILLRMYHARALKRSTKIISISEATKQDTIKLFGTNPEKITTVYPGFNHIGDLEQTSVPVPEKFFLFVGVIKERKNVMNIVKAFEIFVRKNNGTKLLIAGKKSGKYFERVSEYVKERQLEERVLFVGFITDSELSFLYHKAEALVFPSLIEGFGFPILEAMDAGLPVITSNGSSLSEIAGDAALKVVPESAEDIARAMGDIVRNRDLRMRLIAAGKNRTKRFDWEKCAEETVKMLNTIATT